jgi:tripartite ATP-independent transporter DctP family solute receptor
MKKLISIAVVLMLLVSVGMVSAGQYTGRKIQSKFATEEIEGDFMTVFAQDFAKEMKTWSDGKIDISVYPYGTLGDTRDINELCQIGVVDFVYSDYAWISSFVPQAQVLALHYLWPREKITEVINWVVKNGETMKIMEEKFRHNGLIPLAITFEGWHWITTKKPINSMDDMKGLKIRLMSSKLLVENFKAYGASPTPMQFGEIYGALQTGIIDAQSNPLWGNYSMKFFEVTDYQTLTWAEPFLGIPTVNMKFFDSLPKNTQDKMRQYWLDVGMNSKKWVDERVTGDKEKTLKEKPSTTFTVLSEDKIAEFKVVAKTVYPKFIEIGGEGAQSLLDTLLKDVDNAKKALGVK